MSDYATARTRLFIATMDHRNALASYNEARDPIAAEKRGSKASLSESDKYAVQQRMWDEHSDLVFALEVAEQEKIVAEFDLDIADDAGKNWRREMESATADKWMAITGVYMDVARMNAEHTEFERASADLYRAIADTYLEIETRQANRIVATFGDGS